ncbi:MAG: ABC transporter ATP-binding protein [Chloroflexi bacterium]|nr:MAG: ABC transporter ATP-binding protein [Chloroflexota bacterium]HDN79048.1 ABC transporter ATP-binding protein [Chloroflexota bacterium]
MSENILTVKNLKVLYATRAGLVKAVDNVSLEVRRGEVLGLVGESGCGKSTLGLSILRLIPPPGKITDGQIFFNGEDLLAKTEEEMRSIRGKHIAMVFQDPMTSLDPLFRIGDQMVETILTHEKGTSKKEARERAMEILMKLGIGSERFDDYPHQLSGGMRQRVMIGLALLLNPDLLIADEPTTALDVIVEAQILDLLKDLRKTYNITLILITHNMGVVAQLADRVAVMYAGKLVEVGEAMDVFYTPLHPYTEGLLRSIPNISLEHHKLETMPGSPPDLITPPPGCRFHPRCPYVMEICSREEPPLKSLEEGHLVACWKYA